jgi:MFS family permease
VVLGISFVTLGSCTDHLAFPIFFVAPQDFGAGAAPPIFSANMMVAGLSAPLVGYLVDRYGPRRVLPWGAVLLGGGFLLSAAISQLWHLWLAFGVLGAAGGGILGPVAHTTLLSNWFIRSRGTALGVAFAKIKAGLFVFAPRTQFAIDRVGWRGAFIVLGCWPWRCSCP